MFGHLRANVWLLALTVLLGCVFYPLALLGVGQTMFPDRAQGSLILGPDGNPVGSRLIAQPFTADEYFQPRPSAASYNGAASGASNWGANNYLLRERVARQLGPTVRYASGPKKGQLVAPDIERWFQADHFGARPGLVAQWAEAHGGVAQNWVKADKLNAEFVSKWQESHAGEVTQWLKDNSDIQELKPEDLAVPFFTSYSKDYPGTFPSAVEHKTPDGKVLKKIEPIKQGTDIQGIFFDMWLQAHPDADLEPVPADMVMASGSGLDPHITLKNAHYQLHRVAARWAQKTNRDEAEIRAQIQALLRGKTEAPLGGLVGPELINVLEVNLALRERYGVRTSVPAQETAERGPGAPAQGTSRAPGSSAPGA
jgi:K+-transporting ATPase ATPase C chain